jgi:Tfp pilus assembly protein PilF/predicted Ser/Thr protein kinase
MAGDELIGRTIASGRYEIVQLLGEGGMGAVYQARQVAMDRMVALKLIQPELVRSPAAAARFQREMKLTARIEHPNTIRVYDFGETEGQLFLTMELLRGRTLASVLAQSGRLDLPRIVRIATQVCRALQAAHSEGVVHRDLKPDNVMLLEQYGERDVVKVLDFGIAKSLDERDPGVTTVGAVLGTPAYMSAEQAMGRPVDQRSDLYSLGVMLYEMASGRVPFTAPALTALLVAHATEAPPPLAQVAPGVHLGLVAVIDELLRKDPEARPQTAKAVEQRLEALQGGVMAGPLPGSHAPVAISPTMPVVPPVKSGSRGIWLALLVIVLVGGGVAAAILVPRSQAPAQPSPQTSAPPSPRPAADVAARLAAARAKLAGFGDPAPPDACPPGAAADAAELVIEARRRIATDAAGALEAADKALQNCPSAAAAHNIRGNALQATGKLDDAGDAYARALQFAPDYEAPRFNLGVIQLRRRDPAAIATFSEVLRRKPEDPDAYKSRAQAYTHAERYDEAAADLEQALRRKADDGRAWLLLAVVREQARKGDANEAYCRAAALGIGDAAARCKK